MTIARAALLTACVALPVASASGAPRALELWHLSALSLADYWAPETGRYCLLRLPEDMRLHLLDLESQRVHPLAALPGSLPMWMAGGTLAVWPGEDSVSVAAAEDTPSVSEVELPGRIWMQTVMPAPGEPLLAALIARGRETVPQALAVLDVASERVTVIDLGGIPLRPSWTSSGLLCYGWQTDGAHWYLAAWDAGTRGVVSEAVVALPEEVAARGLTTAIGADPLPGFFVVFPDPEDPALQAIGYWRRSELVLIADRVRAYDWSPASGLLAVYREPEYEYTTADGVPAYTLKEANGLFLFDARSESMDLAAGALAPGQSFQRPPLSQKPILRWTRDGRHLWHCHGSPWPTGTLADSAGPVAAIELVDGAAAKSEQRLAARGWFDNLWLSGSERCCAVRLFLRQDVGSVAERIFFLPLETERPGSDVLDTSFLPGVHRKFVTWLTDEIAVVASGDDPAGLQLTALEVSWR